jgi:hypothetical protein
MVAGDPNMELIPVAEPLGVATNPCQQLIDEGECFADDRSIMAGGVRCLVDTGERSEDEVRPRLTDAPNDLLADRLVDPQPAAYVTAKVGPRRPRDRAERPHAAEVEVADAILGRETAADDAQGTDAPWTQLEDRWRAGVEVSIDSRELIPDVASRCPRK